MMKMIHVHVILVTCFLLGTFSSSLLGQFSVVEEELFNGYQSLQVGGYDTDGAQIVSVGDSMGGSYPNFNAPYVPPNATHGVRQVSYPQQHYVTPREYQQPRIVRQNYSRVYPITNYAPPARLYAAPQPVLRGVFRNNFSGFGAPSFSNCPGGVCQ